MSQLLGATVFSSCVDVGTNLTKKQVRRKWKNEEWVSTVRISTPAPPRRAQRRTCVGATAGGRLYKWVCMRVRVDVYIYACMNIHTCVCVYVCVWCVRERQCVCLNVLGCMATRVHKWKRTWMYQSIYSPMYIYINICAFIYVYIYVNIHTSI